jgi:hypothetical protein
MPEKPVRTCVGCGQTDDHPKHIIVSASSLGAAETESAFHMDCHTRVTPPCDVCASQIQGAHGAQGDALRSHLTQKGQQ